MKKLNLNTTGDSSDRIDKFNSYELFVFLYGINKTFHDKANLLLEEGKRSYKHQISLSKNNKK